MKINRHFVLFETLLLAAVLLLTSTAYRLRADTGSCGGQTITLPFTDVQGNAFFCAIALAYFSGLTNGTTATTYSPGNNVTREQMAAFVGRTLDQSVKRSHTRAALGEWWTNVSPYRWWTFGGRNPQYLACDGQTVWFSSGYLPHVGRADIKTGQYICGFDGIPSPRKIVIVSGYVFIASYQAPGKIYYTDISQTTNGTLSSLPGTVGNNPIGITFDGENLWTANNGTGSGSGSISSYNLSTHSVSTFSGGFNQPVSILFDGVNLWVTNQGDASLKRVNISTGAVLQSIPLSGTVRHPVFDGTNLWIPCSGPDQIYVVRAVGGPPLLGTVLTQLTGNGLNGPAQAAFDGERICVSNSAGQTVSLWKASDLSPLTSVGIANGDYYPRGICSDGVTFFVGLRDQLGGTGRVVRL